MFHLIYCKKTFWLPADQKHFIPHTPYCVSYITKILTSIYKLLLLLYILMVFIFTDFPSTKLYINEYVHYNNGILGHLPLINVMDTSTKIILITIGVILIAITSICLSILLTLPYGSSCFGDLAVKNESDRCCLSHLTHRVHNGSKADLFLSCH
jgi:hypothetical protein